MAAKKITRDTELASRPAIKKRLTEAFNDIQRGFIDQSHRADEVMDYWDIYNCELGEQQYYNGNAKIFVPIVHNAIDARKTRFTNQVFPKSGRCVEVIDENGDPPYALTALAEHYVRKAKLRTLVAPSLNKNGDIEGQYNLYVGWRASKRNVAYVEAKNVKVDGLEVEGYEEIEDIEEETLFDEYPYVEVLSDSDVLVQPVLCDTVDDAIEAGGSVTVIRRWSKGQVRRMIDDGEFEEEAGEALITAMGEAAKAKGSGREDIKKQHAEAAGIKDRGKYALGYETWLMLKVQGEMRICRAYYGGDDRILGCKLNPYWCDRVPVISAPVEKVAGQFKGISKVKACAQMQYAANDAVNEGMDSATYALLPIILTDPAKNPKTNTMILDLAAVWEADPNSTSFAKFPDLWKGAFEIVGACTANIFQTLSVNPAMMPQSSGSPSGKRNQAEIANEQQVDILTTADVVGVQEEAVYTPIVQRFMEYDAQFRRTKISIRQFGEMGLRAAVTKVEPIQMGNRYEFRWLGVETARNAAERQQQIAAMNVLRGIPPALLGGRQLDLSVPAERLVEGVFGARDAPLILKDIRHQLAVEPEIENQMLEEQFTVDVHPYDDDVKHLMAHMMIVQNDPAGVIRAHIVAHQEQMAKKANAAQAASQQGGAGAQPGGGPLPGPANGGLTAPGTPPGAAPAGIAGVPRPGSQPQGPVLLRGPAGAIPPDQMPRAGAVPMPRRM